MRSSLLISNASIPLNSESQILLYNFISFDRRLNFEICLICIVNSREYEANLCQNQKFVARNSFFQIHRSFIGLAIEYTNINWISLMKPIYARNPVFSFEDEINSIKFFTLWSVWSYLVLRLTCKVVINVLDLVWT